MSLNSSGKRDSFTQVYQLLALVSNPEAFAKKIEQLRTKEEEVKVLLSRIGPAGEILQIREQIKAEKDVQTNLTEETRTKCDSLLEEAQQRATEIMSEVEAKKGQIEINALETKAAADVTRAEAAEDRKGVDEAMAEIVSWREEIYSVQK